MSGMILSFYNFQPRVAPTAFIAPTAVLIGDIEIGEDCGIWFGCVLRGDGNAIRQFPICVANDVPIVEVCAVEQSGPPRTCLTGCFLCVPESSKATEGKRDRNGYWAFHYTFLPCC